MVELIIKHFVRDSENTSSPRVRTGYGTVCGIVGIVLNLILFVGKFFAGIISGSVAVTADAFNNLSDAGSSVITLLGFAISNKKPNKNNPFGFGRVEYLSGLCVSFLIMLMGYELARSSVDKLINPEKTDFSLLTIIILAISVLVKVYMSLYNRKFGKKINSSAMLATASDSLSDALSTGVVLVVGIITRLTGFIYLDGACGLLVAMFILYAGFNAAKETISPLLGSAPEPEFVDKIRDIMFANEHIHGIHDLIVHDYGPGRVFISLHAEVSAKEDVMLLHDVIDCLEEQIASELNCLAVIHTDPLNWDDAEYKMLNEKIGEWVCEVVPCAKFHDFRMVSGDTHTNLIFDVLIPADTKISNDEIIAKISDKITGFNDKYKCVIKIDLDYTGRY